MERPKRLSRSRDFAAVYRQGRSVSTRSLTLHWFARDDEDEASGPPVARVGFAVPRAVGTAVARTRLKRQLRAAWGELDPPAPSGRDYVVAARPGLGEASEARGHAWLLAQLAEIVGMVSP